MEAKDNSVKPASVKRDDMETAVANLQAFEDSVSRLCTYQSQMNSMYLNIIDSIRILMKHGVEKECNTLQEYITAFKEKYPKGVDAYAIRLLESAAGKYDEFYEAFSAGNGQFQHASIRGIVNAARIYKELEKDMFYDRGVKFECATEECFIAVSRLDMY